MPEGGNLVNIWRRVHGEGYKKGRKSLLHNLEKKMENKFEEGVKKGMDLGREEGYTVTKERFDSIVKRLKAREASKNTSLINSGTQTYLTITTTSVSDSLQTNLTSYLTSSTQTIALYTISHPKMDCSIQMNPSSIQMSCPIIKSSSSSSPTLLLATWWAVHVWHCWVPFQCRVLDSLLPHEYGWGD